MGILGDLKNQRLTAAEIAQVRQFPLSGSGGLSVTGGGAGTSIGYTDPPRRVTEFRVAKVVNAGPDGEDDWTDERYWLSFQAAETAGATVDPDDPDADPSNEFLTFYDATNEHPDDQTVTATNLAEWAYNGGAGGTHTLATDGTAVVLAFLWHDDNGTERWVFNRAVAVGVLVKITANQTGGGKYDGTVYGGTMTSTNTGNATLPEGLTAGQSCLVVNDDEDGQPTHWVQLNTYAEGFYGGMSTESTPRPVVRIQRAKYRTASPQTFGSAAERTTAATDSWSRIASTSGSAYGDTPIELWVCTGVFYDHAAGTPALTALMRKVTLAADGRPHALSAESSYVIDTPDACA
jgi:hypothetical protein